MTLLLLPVKDQSQAVRYRPQFQPNDPVTGQPALDPNGQPVVGDQVLVAGGSLGNLAFGLIASHAVFCGATAGDAVLVVPFSATRRVLHIFNRTAGSETVDVGPTISVTVNGGIPLYASGGFTFDGQGAQGPFYAVSPVASTPLSYVEG